MIMTPSAPLAQAIRHSALAAGFDQCGIVPLEAFAGYRDALARNSEAFPASGPLYAHLARLTDHSATPWARAVVVSTYRYSRYRLPEGLDRHIARYYLLDWHNRPETDGYKAVRRLEEALDRLGVRHAREDIFSIAPARMAAQLAGLGRIRRNNFFYNDAGSWVWLETWLIDQPLQTAAPAGDLPPPCPPDCRACQDACPTRALRAPYRTDMALCATRLAYSARDYDSPGLRDLMGTWVYGCDACQSACPMNTQPWNQGAASENAALENLKRDLGLEALATLGDGDFRARLQPIFRFIAPDNGWVLRSNALRAMGNSGDGRYAPTVARLVGDADPRVAEMARWALEKLQNAPHP